MRFVCALLLIAAPSGCDASHQGLHVDGERAFVHLREIVSYGPRLPGTEASAKARAYCKREIEKLGFTAEEDPFVAKTPKGPIAMTNLLVRIPGEKEESILIGSHYDTVDIGHPPCPGANDGGSSSALLLEIARALSQASRRKMTVRLAFFDGEEAIQRWSAEDSLYGSRHLVERWGKEGTLKTIKAMILLDLVGDKELGIFRDSISSGWLVDMIRDSARELGHQKYFFQEQDSFEDDHRPFLAAGIPSIDLIDGSYGPRRAIGLGAYWHTPEDRIERCSPQSLQIVGDVVLHSLSRIEERFR